jgi:hypothetical protein
MLKNASDMLALDVEERASGWMRFGIRGGLGFRRLIRSLTLPAAVRLVVRVLASGRIERAGDGRHGEEGVYWQNGQRHSVPPVGASLRPFERQRAVTNTPALPNGQSTCAAES